MKKDTLALFMDDGKKIALHRWIPDGEIKAIVQLSHGMTEYAKCYDRLGEVLVQNGFVFYAHDHRGHGETAENLEDLGFLAEKDGFNRVAKDLHTCIQIAHREYPNKKIFLLAHSFGSFIAQAFIEQSSDEIAGCMLSGTAGPRLALTSLATLLSKLVQILFGKRFRSHCINSLSFSGNNQRIKNIKTPNDWLTRDENRIQQYSKDPYCTFIPTVSFFYELFNGLRTIHQKNAIKSIRNDLPLFLFSGTDDPVGSYGKTVANLYKIYRHNGITDVSLKLYEGGRHEMLNEINKEEVEADILSWINRHI